jgi:hypothetical protein
MGKIIIHNNSDLDDHKAVAKVLSVINDGLVSQTNGIKHYCHLTRFDSGILICCVNRGKDKNTFYVERE